MISNVVKFPEVMPLRRGDHVELGEHLLLELKKRQGKIVYDDGALYQYDYAKHAYFEVTHDDQERIVQSFAGRTIGSGDKAKPLKLRWPDVHGAINCARSSVTETGFFASAAPGLSFANVFVQIGSDGSIELLDHDPEHRVRFAYSFDYEPDAPLPERWHDFLADCFCNDPDGLDKVSLLQEYCGAALLGYATLFQRALILCGTGSNGKSVFGKVIEQCFPPGSTIAVPPQQWGDEYRQAMIAGKRLNVVSELPEGDILESEKFKAIVAGDSITGRHIRRSPFQFKPIAGHIFSANRLPATDDHTYGFWRRMLMVSFNREFSPEQENPMLVEELLEERPGIVRWLFEGARRALTQRRLTVPPSHGDLLGAWRRYADQVQAFVDEMVEPCTVDEGVLANTLYSQYHLWAQGAGHKPMAKNKFGMRMRQCGYKPEHTEKGNRYALKIVDNRGEFM